MNAILDEIIPYHGQLNYDLITLYDPNGLTIARADMPGIFGKSDELTPLVLKKNDDRQSSLEVSMYNGKLALLSLARLKGTAGPLSVLVVGNYLDQKSIDDFAATHALKVIFYFNDKQIMVHPVHANLGVEKSGHTTP